MPEDTVDQAIARVERSIRHDVQPDPADLALIVAELRRYRSTWRRLRVMIT